MLDMVSDIWWRRIHRKEIAQARQGEHCLQIGKSMKSISRQSQLGKVTENNEISLDLAVSLQKIK